MNVSLYIQSQMIDLNIRNFSLENTLIESSSLTCPVDGSKNRALIDVSVNAFVCTSVFSRSALLTSSIHLRASAEQTNSFLIDCEQPLFVSFGLQFVDLVTASGNWGEQSSFLSSPR